MKIPSLIKVPSHQRFHIKPRYYDPVKEEVEHRERLIIAEIEAKKKKGTYVAGTRVSTGFNRERAQKYNSNLIQLLLIVLLLGGTVGYLFFGNVAIYTVFGLVVGIIILKRFKRP